MLTENGKERLPGEIVSKKIHARLPVTRRDNLRDSWSMKRSGGEAELGRVCVHRTQRREKAGGKKSHIKNFESHPQEFVLFPPKQSSTGNRGGVT